MIKDDLDDSWRKGVTDERTDNAVSRVAFATEKGKGNGKRRWQNWKI